MSSTGGVSAESTGAPVPTCYRHSDRETYLRCQRCDRYVCPDCMREASVGFHCLDCFDKGRRSTPSPRTRFGGVMHANSTVATLTLMGLNAAVFVLYVGFGSVVVEYLALLGHTWDVPGVAGGEVWRLLTSAFVHAEVWHIGVNMISLWILGRPLEQLLGRLRFVGVYLAAAFAGSAVAFTLTAPNVWVFGASGAVFGLFGVVVMLLRQMQADMRMVLVMLAINVAVNVMFWQVLSWQGHLGGFVAGLVLGAVLGYAPRQRRMTWHVAGYVGVLAICLALVVGRTAVLLNSVGTI